MTGDERLFKLKETKVSDHEKNYSDKKLRSVLGTPSCDWMAGDF